MQAPTPLGKHETSGYFRILVARNEWTMGTERLVADIWSHSGRPVATIYVNAKLTG